MRVVTKTKKVVQDGLVKAELNNFFTKELAEDGYAGLEVRRGPNRTEIVISATRTQNVLGERGRRIRELTSVVQKRFGQQLGDVELFAEKINNRGLCAIAQCESLRFKLCGGLAVRRACYGVMRFIMESNAKGVEIVVSGKVRGQRAKAMKFTSGVMIHSGDAVNKYVEEAVRHVKLRQGVLGVKVKIFRGIELDLKPGDHKIEDVIIRENAFKDSVMTEAPQVVERPVQQMYAPQPPVDQYQQIIPEQKPMVADPSVWD